MTIGDLCITRYDSHQRQFKNFGVERGSCGTCRYLVFDIYCMRNNISSIRSNRRFPVRTSSL